MVHVQAIIVKMELHIISKVPRELCEGTNMACAGSVVASAAGSAVITANKGLIRK